MTRSSNILLLALSLFALSSGTLLAFNSQDRHLNPIRTQKQFAAPHLKGVHWEINEDEFGTLSIDAGQLLMVGKRIGHITTGIPDKLEARSVSLEGLYEDGYAFSLRASRAEFRGSDKILLFGVKGRIGKRIIQGKEMQLAFLSRILFAQKEVSERRGTSLRGLNKGPLRLR